MAAPVSDPCVILCGMTGSDPKADLRHYLQVARDALLWKLEGLSDYDIRRPLVPTGTNLLGLVKHVAGVEAGAHGRDGTVLHEHVGAAELAELGIEREHVPAAHE